MIILQLISILFLFILVFGFKVCFYLIERNFLSIWIARLDLISVLVFAFALFYFFPRLRKKRVVFNSHELSKTFYVIVVLTFLSIFLSFSINYNKKSLDWDAVAL